jgi:hypothetical protein
VLGKISVLVVLYGGLSIAALLLLAIGASVARSRAEVLGLAAISGTLVLVHAGELVYLASLGQIWMGDGIDPLLVAGAVLLLAAGAATAAFLRRRLSGGTR